MFIIQKNSDRFLYTLMLQNTGTTDGGQKRCVGTRSVQFSGNHHKYYIGWAFVISCSLIGANQTFRGACCLLLHSQTEQREDTDTLYTQGARKNQSDSYEHQRRQW